MEQRVSLITLGVADLPRARAFYEGLGWQVGADPEDVVFFQAGGMVVALWSRERLAEDSGVEDGGGWGGVTLAYNARSPGEVDNVIEQARRAGARIAREPGTTFWAVIRESSSIPTAIPGRSPTTRLTLADDGAVRPLDVHAAHFAATRRREATLVKSIEGAVLETKKNGRPGTRGGQWVGQRAVEQGSLFGPVVRYPTGGNGMWEKLRCPPPGEFDLIVERLHRKTGDTRPERDQFAGVITKCAGLGGVQTTRGRESRVPALHHRNGLSPAERARMIDVDHAALGAERRQVDRSDMAPQRAMTSGTEAPGQVICGAVVLEAQAGLAGRT